MHTTSWLSGGGTVTVTRNCGANQTEADCLREFNAAVTALKLVYPEDP